MAFFLILLGTLSSEISNSIGKLAVARKQETLYSMGFIAMFWSSILFIGLILFGAEFRFSADSLPFFLPRVVLELILAHIAIKSVIVADRTTVSFLRMTTIPLLLMVDIIIGYEIMPHQIYGIGLLLIALAIIFWKNPSGQKGAGIVLLGAILAVATTSLFKYNITLHNSVAAEQAIISIVLLSYFLIFSMVKFNEKPWTLLRHPYAQAQSISHGVAGLLISFAYLYAPASVIISLKRSLAVFWATISGNTVFHERHIVRKIISFLVATIGIVLLTQ